MLADKCQIDLPHQLFMQADLELVSRHFLERTPMHVAGNGNGNDGIDLPDLVEELEDTVLAGNVDLMLPLIFSGLDDFMARSKLLDDQLADRARCAYDYCYYRPQRKLRLLL